LLAAQPPATESKRPATGTASGDDYNGDAMLTFERAPKSRTPKLADWAEFPRKKTSSFVSGGQVARHFEQAVANEEETHGRPELSVGEAKITVMAMHLHTLR
jgi:hypothetical protein